MKKANIKMNQTCNTKKNVVIFLLHLKWLPYIPFVYTKYKISFKNSKKYFKKCLVCSLFFPNIANRNARNGHNDRQPKTN